MDKPKTINNFLDQLEASDTDKHQIVIHLVELTKNICPHVQQRMMYGGIMFSNNGDDFGGVFASKNHVSFEFSDGYLLDDPDGILEGTGKKRRHLKIRNQDDINTKHVTDFVEQATK